MQEPEYANVILDTHPYQCFTDDDRKRDLHGQVGLRARWSGRSCWTAMQQQLPCIVGEWSCALPPESLEGGQASQLDVAMRAYGDAQLINFDAHARAGSSGPTRPREGAPGACATASAAAGCRRGTPERNRLVHGLPAPSTSEGVRFMTDFARQPTCGIPAPSYV